MRAVIVSAGCVLALGLLTACGGGDPKDGGTVTVTVPPSPASPPSSAASASPSPTPSPVATTLPGTCASLLADYRVSTALGGGVDLGQTSFVIGVPDRAIGRLSTINCRYGVTGSGAAQKAKVEIGVSLYATAAQAEARITATSDDYVAHGATPSQVQVQVTPDPTASTTPGSTAPTTPGSTTSTTPGSAASTTPGSTASPAASSVPATVLSGGVGDGYTLPLLVAAVDRRTIAVTVDPATVTSAQAARTVAALAIQRTAG